MDLRPLNPYYHRAAKQQFRMFRMAAVSAEEYSYPYLWITPITDRCQADVDRLKEFQYKGLLRITPKQLAEYLTGMKGALNRTDLERIENNVQILLDVLEIEAGSNVGNVPQFPTENYFNQLLSNVSAIREAYCIHQTTPETPQMPLNTWQKWNDIEQILYDVHEILCNNFHYYCGDGLYLGQETALLL